MQHRTRRAGAARAWSGRRLLVVGGTVVGGTVACASAGPVPEPDRGPRVRAAAFVPVAVHVVRASGYVAYFVRLDEVIVVTAPFRQAQARGRGRAEAFVVGERGAAALHVTGPRAHEIVVPLTGPAMPGWERLRTDTATAGRFTATPVWRVGVAGDAGDAVLDSMALTVERLVFPRGGAVRMAPVTRPVLVPPP